MTIIRVITIVFQELLPTEGLSYLDHIARVMHQEEVMREHFFLHVTYLELLRYCF